MCMADDSLGDVLENRYASQHVGGAFDAKHLEKPKTLEEAQSDATFGRKPEDSLMLEGLNTDKYIKNDQILPEREQPNLYGIERFVEPRVAKPSNVPLRSPVITKLTSDKGSTVRVSSAAPPSVIPGGTVKRNNLVTTVTPGQNPRTNSVTPPSVVPGGTLRRTVIPRKITPSGNVGIVLGKAEPSGNGMPGVPSSRPFIPRQRRPAGPLISLPTMIYWDTDPDMWDYTKLVGQTNWDS